MEKPRTELLLELIAQELHRAHVVKAVEGMIQQRDKVAADLWAGHANSLLQDIDQRRTALGLFRKS